MGLGQQCLGNGAWLPQAITLTIVDLSSVMPTGIYREGNFTLNTSVINHRLKWKIIELKKI